jgi:hypothetical protein
MTNCAGENRGSGPQKRANQRSESMKHFIKLLVLLGLFICGVGVALAAPPAKTGGEYTVQPGDCLAKLAERFYGSQKFWPAIWQATNNRALTDSRFTMISNPHVIHSGQILWLPAEVEPPPAEIGSAEIGPASEASGLLTVDLMYIGHMFNGQIFERRSEILRNLKSKTLETTQRAPLEAVSVQDGLIRLQIREEKPETTYLDAFGRVPIECG